MGVQTPQYLLRFLLWLMSYLEIRFHISKKIFFCFFCHGFLTQLTCGHIMWCVLCIQMVSSLALCSSIQSILVNILYGYLFSVVYRIWQLDQVCLVFTSILSSWSITFQGEVKISLCDVGFIYFLKDFCFFFLTMISLLVNLNFYHYVNNLFTPKK